MRFTVTMSGKWTWVFGILTAGAFLLGIVFFVATQQLLGRDWVVLGIGALIGTTATALLATFVFHSDDRAKRQAANEVAVQTKASADIARLDKLAGAEAELLQKKTSLIAALPTRTARLTEIHEEIAQTNMNIVVAHGNAESGKLSARSSASYNFNDIAHEQLAAAKTWEIAELEAKRQLPALEAERDRIGALTDEEYLAEQKHLRGLD